MSTGLSQNEAFTKWEHPSVDHYRESIRQRNDGTQPLEPYQRVSQEVFESWMRDMCEHSELIDLRYGHKLEFVKENEEGVEAQVTTNKVGERLLFRSRYAVACDGASSKSRQSLEIGLDGGPMYETLGSTRYLIFAHHLFSTYARCVPLG